MLLVNPTGGGRLSHGPVFVSPVPDGVRAETGWQTACSESAGLTCRWCLTRPWPGERETVPWRRQTGTV